MSRNILNFKSIPLTLAAAAVLTAIPTGCGMSTGSDLPAGTQLSGVAMGGRQPIVGSAVTLYATGASGYGSAATTLGTATTGSSGQFTITTNSNTCTGSQQLYLVASSGNAGSGTNTAAVLVEALGGCSSVGAGTTNLVINELTTVAAAYALQGFADTTTNIGTSSTNAQGLTHGVANALNLVSLTGTVNSTTAGGNGTVPTAVINTIANILASCVNSSGPSSTACTTILLGAPTVVGAAAPTTVWQEALNMARYPAYQTAALYASVTTTGPFQTSLAAVPNDLSIGIPYSAGYESGTTTLTNDAWDIKADANDNIWETGLTDAGLVELSNVGTLLSPTAGGWGNASLVADFTRDIGIDTLGNVWTATTTGSTVFEYTPGGTPTSPTAGTTTAVTESFATGPVGVAVDGNNNVWFGTEGTASATQGIGEIAAGSGTATTPSNNAYSSSAVNGTYGFFVDASSIPVHIYAGSESSASTGTVYQYVNPGSSNTPANLGPGAVNGLGIDKNGKLWVSWYPTTSAVNDGTLSLFTPGNTTPTYTCKVTATTGNGLYNPRGLIIDGSNRIFVMSYTAGSIIEFDPALGNGCGDVGNDLGTFFVTSVGTGIEPSNSAGTDVVADPRNGTIDSSGALWIASNSSTAGVAPVVQILGIAAPVNPVYAAGKYGVKP